MPLFKPILARQRDSGLLQSVICPFCREELREEDHLSTTGEGVNTRKVTARYSCGCGYKVDVVERYPIIHRAIK
jgi:hypothetical protein